MPSRFFFGVANPPQASFQRQQANNNEQSARQGWLHFWKGMGRFLLNSVWFLRYTFFWDKLKIRFLFNQELPSSKVEKKEHEMSFNPLCSFLLSQGCTIFPFKNKHICWKSMLGRQFVFPLNIFGLRPPFFSGGHFARKKPSNLRSRWDELLTKEKQVVWSHLRAWMWWIDWWVSLVGYRVGVDDFWYKEGQGRMLAYLF